MTNIRNEAHTRSRFASKKYYALIRQFVSAKITIKDNKLKKDFNPLSGVLCSTLHRDLERCYRIYSHYRTEYNQTLDIINLLQNEAETNR